MYRVPEAFAGVMQNFVTSGSHKLPSKFDLTVRQKEIEFCHPCAQSCHAQITYTSRFFLRASSLEFLGSALLWQAYYTIAHDLQVSDSRVISPIFGIWWSEDPYPFAKHGFLSRCGRNFKSTSIYLLDTIWALYNRPTIIFIGTQTIRNIVFCEICIIPDICTTVGTIVYL